MNASHRANHLILAWCTMLVLARVISHSAAAEPAGQSPTDKKPTEAVLVDPSSVTEDAVASWRNDGFTSLVLLLDERFEVDAYKRALDVLAPESFGIYYWIEVGRNPRMAREHPEWMASLGAHDDWRGQFPGFRELKKGEVVKAWPWIPIGYEKAFDAHAARIAGLLMRVPQGYRGILLNDLQGGPSSCGCGNLQCRWALDYGVPRTASRIAGNNVAARFVAEVKRLSGRSEVIPVWTIECEAQDMAIEKLADQKWTTGYCGGVDCFNNCRDRFAEQWSTLHAEHIGPTALLLLHKEFKRDRVEYGEKTDWVARAVDYLSQDEIRQVRPQSLCLVVQGFDVTREEEAAARQSAKKTTADLIVVARARIDQSYEPRVMLVKGKKQEADKSAGENEDTRQRNAG